MHTLIIKVTIIQLAIHAFIVILLFIIYKIFINTSINDTCINCKVNIYYLLITMVMLLFTITDIILHTLRTNSSEDFIFITKSFMGFPMLEHGTQTCIHTIRKGQQHAGYVIVFSMAAFDLSENRSIHVYVVYSST